MDAGEATPEIALGFGHCLLHDSEPEAEYRETLDKARPLLAALDRLGRL